MPIFDIAIAFSKDEVFAKLYALPDSDKPSDSLNLQRLELSLFGKTYAEILGDSSNAFMGILTLEAIPYAFQKLELEEGFVLLLSRDSLLSKLYAEALDQVSEGIQIYDQNGYFLFGNTASEQLEQYSRSHFKGKHIIDLYELQEEFSTVLTVLRTKMPVLNRCDRFQVKNGKTLTTINSGFPIETDGKLSGAVVFESDLSVLEQVKKRLTFLEQYTERREPEYQNDLFRFEDLVHQSESMAEVIHFAKKISFTDSSILILGETGTGKELVAQSIHSFSPRRHKPFVDVNCSAVPSNLFESLFFGTEKGAFTGSQTTKGYFEMADGGTLFLDEVNSISPEMQAKLLRTLQSKKFQRIGGTKSIKCDVRIIAASNEDIDLLIESHRMRKDFYYRISTLKIDLPRLEDRREDISLLSQYFLDSLLQKYNRSPLTLSQDTLSLLEQSQWPGNVRELQHVIEYAFSRIADGEAVIEPHHLPRYMKAQDGCAIRIIENDQNQTLPLIDESAFETSPSLSEQLELFEQKVLMKTLNSHKGNVTHAAKALGISRQNLQYRLRKFSCSDDSTT